MQVLNEVPLDIRVQLEHTGANRCNAPGYDCSSITKASLGRCRRVKQVAVALGKKLGLFEAINANPAEEHQSIEGSSLSSKLATLYLFSLKHALTWPVPLKNSSMLYRTVSSTLEVQVNRSTSIHVSESFDHVISHNS